MTNSQHRAIPSLMQCVITKSMSSMGNNFVITPLLMQYPIYKHHALWPIALGISACNSDIAHAGV